MHRLKTRAQFQAVMAGGTVSRTAHFALHRLVLRTAATPAGPDPALKAQESQALFGVSDGRVLGEGLGRGFPEIVPIADSDFIYAAIAEEMGLAGGAVIIVAFILLMVAGMRTAIEARDMYTKLLAAGITAFLGFQAVVNIGGVIRMLPMTGITLPFVSHGGWSLITCFVMIGMLMAISDRNNSEANVSA